MGLGGAAAKLGISDTRTNHLVVSDVGASQKAPAHEAAIGHAVAAV